ncbi:unnamed protein product [Lymnaea stagnalis]|uniref:CARD domain-containing protein n=1 Tax=Lymnaea stagnalis TaxID=6523 RepID=A0AAV2H7Y2_LYMST
MDRVVKRTMKDSLASKLRKNLPYIEEHVEAKELLSYLFANSIIDVDDRESVSRAGTRKERACSLVTLLMHRGDRAYACFLEALRNARYTFVANKISGLPYQTSEDSDAGAGAAHVDLVTVSIPDRIASIEHQTGIYGITLERISRRLDEGATKEDLKLIQLEISNLEAAFRKELEMEKLKSQLKAKEDELARLSAEMSDQVQQLLAEIASLKQQAVNGERELQQFMREKAQLETKVQDLITKEASNNIRIETVEKNFEAFSSEIKKMVKASIQPKHKRSSGCRCEACNRPPEPAVIGSGKSHYQWKY